MYFGTHFSVKCQLCTQARKQHGRHEAWDEKSAEKREVLGARPSASGAIEKKLKSEDSCVFLNT